MQSRKVPELLAPAGSFEALESAIGAGADAVYLGGKNFGARRYAANFERDDLERAVEFSHLRDVRVYVTVNTLIADRELPEVADYLVWLYEIGVDAVLVQDIGVANLARELVPGLELHASTQMTIHNLEGAFWAARSGFKRVVLARELGLAEVEEIARNVPIGAEVFVHGALCYCYSGQCLLSSLIGGRSGNRGMCAQPCRKPYELVFGLRDSYGRLRDWEKVPLEERYLMSTKDLAVYPDLDKVVDAGVASLKIEGRMRSPEYVSVVTSIYRKALDAISEGEWKPSCEDEKNLALAFNRGFTRGYLLGDWGRALMGRERPDNRGVFVGKAVSWDWRRGEVGIRLDSSFVPEQGDGIVFRWSGGENGGVLWSPPRVWKGLLWLKFEGRVGEGAKVYVTRRARLVEDVLKEREFLPVHLKLSLDDDLRPLLEGWTSVLGKRAEVSIRGSFSMEVARSRPLSLDDVKAQLQRTGGTPFCVCSFEMDYPGGLFAPLGELNRLRREFFGKLGGKIVRECRPSREHVESSWKMAKIFARGYNVPPTHPLLNQRPILSIYTSTFQEVKGALNGDGNKRIYFEPFIKLKDDRPCTCGGHDKKDSTNEALEEIKKVSQICESKGTEFVWKWPKINRKHFLKFAVPALDMLKDKGVNAIMVENIGAAEAAKKTAPDVEIFGSVGLNVWNHLTVRRLGQTFACLTISPELSSREIKDITTWPKTLGTYPSLEMIVQGNLEAIVTEDHLVSTALGCKKEESRTSREKAWGLRDSTKRIFPLETDGECRTHILNSVEMCLIDQIPEILGFGINSLAIDARHRSEKYAREMTTIYEDAMRISAEGGNARDLEVLKKETKRRSRGGITKGAFAGGRKEQ